MDNKTLCDGIERIASETLRYSEGDLFLGKLMALQDVLELMVHLLRGTMRNR